MLLSFASEEAVLRAGRAADNIPRAKAAAKG
jgi:hypothetical protein